ncbi:MAG TPA: hypothetical protein VIN38_00850 [Thiobacillus sp.]
MNQAQNTMTHDGEIPIYDAVRDMDHDKLAETINRNAASLHFDLTDEHLDVIFCLVDHYKQDCKSRDCLAAHEHMRFLEEAFASKGGSKYLYMLFDAMPGMRGVLMPIHELAGLPALRLASDEGFGTAF